MAGHFPPEISRVMEEEFASLLDRLGYLVERKRDFKSGIDIIATFFGEPISRKLSHKCELLKPPFSPKGRIAFSLKRGDFVNGDVDELLEKIKRAKSSNDELLQLIEGAVIVTNYIKTEAELDKLLSGRDVYCWDGRRLTFYSAKARSIFDMASKGPVREVAIENFRNASYLIKTETVPGAIIADIATFIDDHDKNLMISYDHIKSILVYVYEKSLKPISESTGLDVQAVFKIHVLGVADKALVDNAYMTYAKDIAAHPKVVFSAPPTILQYGAAPWASLFSL